MMTTKTILDTSAALATHNRQGQERLVDEAHEPRASGPLMGH